MVTQIKNLDLYDLLKSLDLGDLKYKDHYGLSMVLGSAEFSMRELIFLYGILANNGFFQKTNETYISGNYVNQSSDKQYFGMY